MFDQLGFSREVATALAMKSALHRRIIRYAKNRNYSQAQLVKILRERQPTVSDLLRGKIARSSLEALVNYAEALDMPRHGRCKELKRVNNFGKNKSAVSSEIAPFCFG